MNSRVVPSIVEGNSSPDKINSTSIQAHQQSKYQEPVSSSKPPPPPPPWSGETRRAPSGIAGCEVNGRTITTCTALSTPAPAPLGTPSTTAYPPPPPCHTVHNACASMHMGKPNPVRPTLVRKKCPWYPFAARQLERESETTSKCYSRRLLSLRMHK